MVKNLPSLDKYENDVKAGGKIFVDSSLIERKVARTDVEAFYVPATQMASDAGLTGLANMILGGKILKELGEFEDEEAVAASLKKVVSVKHPEMYEKNWTALKMGRDY
jgi:2-oxoglutarate ferredoxin oxidoreductase subunit gamma